MEICTALWALWLGKDFTFFYLFQNCTVPDALFSSEERVVLQKLLLLHAYCPRLWLRLAEIELCLYSKQQLSPESAVASTAKLDRCRLTADISSLGNCSVAVTTPPPVSEDVHTDAVCVTDPAPAIGDVPMMIEFKIHSLTCFVAAE